MKRRQGKLRSLEALQDKLDELGSEVHECHSLIQEDMTKGEAELLKMRLSFIEGSMHTILWALQLENKMPPSWERLKVMYED